MNHGLARWFAAGHRERRLFHVCFGLAVGVHAAGLLWMHAQRPRLEAMSVVTEIELAAPAVRPTAPAPSASTPAPRPEPSAAPRPRTKRAPTASLPAAAAAPAAALLTAPETNGPATAEPVRFVSDPNGHGYASDALATGGTSNAKPAAPLPPPAATSERITPAADLQREPLWQGDDCRGYFPERARADLGHVALLAVVRASGSIARLDVQTETPPSQGFAEAARACIQHQHFAPALDRAGRPATARTSISLRFSR